MPALWDDLAALGNLLPTAMLNALLADANAGVESMMRWMLRRGSTPIDIGRETARLGAGVADLAAVLPDVLPPDDREAFDARAAQLREAGLPPDLAGRIAGSDALAYAPDIIELAAQAEIPIGPVASVYFALRDRLDLGWLGDQITALRVPPSGTPAPASTCSRTSRTCSAISPPQSCALPRTGTDPICPPRWTAG